RHAESASASTVPAWRKPFGAWCCRPSSRRARASPSPASLTSIPRSPGRPVEPISCSWASVSSTWASLHLPSMAKPSGEKLIVDNRRARHEYHLSDRVEAGLVLAGTEVKSLRGGQATLQDAYAEVRDGEAGLIGLHVPDDAEGTRTDHGPARARRPPLPR